MNDQIYGREIHAVDPPFPDGYSRSTEQLDGIISQNHSTTVDESHQIQRPSSLKTQDPLSYLVDSPGLSFLLTEDPFFDAVDCPNLSFLDTEDVLLMADYGGTYNVSEPSSDQPALHVSSADKRSSAIVGDVSEKHFMDVGFATLFNNPDYDLPPLHFGQKDEHLSEIVTGVSENQHMAGQILSPQIGYPYYATTEEPSFAAVAPPNSTALAIENRQFSSNCQLILPFDWPMMPTSSSVFPAVKCPPSTSYCQLDNGFGQNNSVYPSFFVDSSTMPSSSAFPAVEYHPSTSYCQLDTGLCQNNSVYPSSFDDSSTMPSSSAFLAVECPPSTSYCQLVTGFSQNNSVYPSSAFPAVEYPPSTSYCQLDTGFGQINSVHPLPFDDRLTWISDGHEYDITDEQDIMLEDKNISSGCQEVDHGKQALEPKNNDRRGCACGKSQCVKRYCECFFSGLLCNEACKCKECKNISEQRNLVAEKRTKLLRDNPYAFAPKIAPLSQDVTEILGIKFSNKNKKHRRGCSCSKSKCLKHYCECFQARVKCSIACSCKDCGNTETIEHVSHDHDHNGTHLSLTGSS